MIVDVVLFSISTILHATMIIEVFVMAYVSALRDSGTASALAWPAIKEPPGCCLHEAHVNWLADDEGRQARKDQEGVKGHRRGIL